jgi:transposase-like protein
MWLLCPGCKRSSTLSARGYFIRSGYYRRKSDQKRVSRIRCKPCKRTFSRATFDPCFRQLKRHVNPEVFKLLASGVSQRRISYLLNINRKTVKRKFLFLGPRAKTQLLRHNLMFPKAKIVEFDDLETFEHSKCKPLSVTLAVESKTRRVLGFEVSSMPAKGLLVKKAFKKYGPRRDDRAKGRRRLFAHLTDVVSKAAEFKSDQNPHYPGVVKEFFPNSRHEVFKGQRGSLGGQGELKKVKFDPLFSLNHSCAKLRADVNRLIRKTWCTTKKAERLKLHLYIFALYHNRQLISPKRV